MNEELFRITSIPFLQKNYAILSGVPLNDKEHYKLKSGKYLVSVIIDMTQLPLPVEPQVGQQWRVVGDITYNKVDLNGYQMSQHCFDQPTTMQCVLPESNEAFIRFISNDKLFKMIGPSKARRIWGAIGREIFDLLKEDLCENRKRLRSCKLTDKSIDCLYEGFRRYKNLEHASWFSEIGLPMRVQQRLFRHLDDRAGRAIRENPYLLVAFGLSFEACDEIAFDHFSLPADNTLRLLAAVDRAIRDENEHGHTYTDQKTIRPTVKKLLGSNELVVKALRTAYDKKQFILNVTTETYHQTTVLLMELIVAKRIVKLASRINLFTDEAFSAYKSALQELPYNLTKKQAQAVLAALDNGIACITGGAGTGKTTVLRTALRAFNELGYSINAVALSGRATMRLHESIGFETMTIYRFLQGERQAPKNNSDRLLLVIDEASMIDVPTMYQIIAHLAPSVRILLTGDPDQLPPIGYGKILDDVVKSGVVVNTTLDIVKRQEGSTGIPEYSRLINQGTVPKKLSVGNIKFHEVAKNDVVAKCTELYAQAPANSRVMAHSNKLVSEINTECQKVVNNSDERLEFDENGDRFFIDYRVGDQILFTKNNYIEGYQNGTLGTLENVDRNDDVFGKVRLDDGTEIPVYRETIDSMQLGYAITLHKAQGSQFPRIIVSVRCGGQIIARKKDGKRMKAGIVDRAWLYTAITRAEHEIHIVGTKRDFCNIVEGGSNAHRRRSFLIQLLKQGGSLDDSSRNRGKQFKQSICDVNIVN